MYAQVVNPRRQARSLPVAIRKRACAGFGQASVSEPVGIKSTDFWGKVVEMLQQNWALIEDEPGRAVRVFSSATRAACSMRLRFPPISRRDRRSGFKRFADSADLLSFLRPPPAPYHRTAHPSGAIYRWAASGDHEGCVASFGSLVGRD
jgi:hypothetical protein